MKLNDRTLASYATSSRTPTDKEGALWKRGEVNRSFQKRHFVLKGNLLLYFEKRGDKEPVGVIILEGCTIELAEDEQEKFAFKIAFHGEGKRTYVLGTDDQVRVNLFRPLCYEKRFFIVSFKDTMESWMKVLACASYDYMKLMVLELQQQLSEIEEAEKNSSTSANTTMSGSNSFPQQLSDQQQQQQQPKAPPRRANPFEAKSAAAAASAASAARRAFPALHAAFGERIRRDREKWCDEQGHSKLVTVS